MEATFSTVPAIPHAFLAAPARPGIKAVWAGRVMTGLVTAFLVFDVLVKLSGHPAVAESSAQMGLPLRLQPVLAGLLATCLALYLVPRTAIAGAILLTGYLGGAVLAHLRVADPLLSHTLFPLYVGAFLWGGLFLRDRRLRVLFARA